MPTVKGQRFAGKVDNLPSKSTLDNIVPSSIVSNKDKHNLWKLLKLDLESRGLWNSTYLIPIQELVETTIRLSNTRVLLDEEGDVIDRFNSDGIHIGVMANPRFNQMTVLQSKQLALVEKLGLSPRDIVFLTVTDEPSPEDAVLYLEKSSEENGIVYFR